MHPSVVWRCDAVLCPCHCRVPQTEIHESQLYEELPAFLRGQVATHLLQEILGATGWWEVRLSPIQMWHRHQLGTRPMHSCSRQAWPDEAYVLQGMPEGERWRLAAIMHPVQLLPGHDLTQAGSRCACDVAAAAAAAAARVEQAVSPSHAMDGRNETGAPLHPQEGEPATCLWLLQVFPPVHVAAARGLHVRHWPAVQLLAPPSGVVTKLLHLPCRRASCSPSSTQYSELQGLPRKLQRKHSQGAQCTAAVSPMLQTLS